MIDANRIMLQRVVDEIGEFRDEVVFVGGAIAGLLITAPAGDPIRETYDVDCIVELGSSILSYHQVERRLHLLGWSPGGMTVSSDPRCRFRKGSLALDVMPTDGSVLGFSARWAREAMSRAIEHRVGARLIRVVSAPYFVAMKLDAFRGRGDHDFYGSHDLEDAIAVVEGRAELVDEISQDGSLQLRAFLSEQLQAMWPQLLEEAVPAATRGDVARSAVVEQRLRAIRSLDG